MGRLRVGYWILLGLAALVILTAALVGQRPFLTYFSLNGMRSMAPAWVLPPLIWLGLLAVKLTLRRSPAPTRTMWRMVRAHRRWIGRGAFFTFLALPLGRAFSAFKSSIPTHTVYWSDGIFAEMDRLMFLGVDPWRITHAAFGPTSTLVLDRLYVLWFVMMMGLLAWLNFTRDLRLQLRGLLSYLLSWSLLGMFGAMAFASVGPIFFDQFYGGDRFAGLTSVLQQQPNLNVHAAAAFLYENRGREVIGSGISAMPSMHVGIAWLFFLVCREAGVSQSLRIGAGVYAAVILVTSVHLGWHYAVDGLFSIAGVSAIWWATGRFVGLLDKQNKALLRRPLNSRPIEGHTGAVEAR